MGLVAVETNHRPSTASTEEIVPNLFFIQRGWLNGNHFAALGEEPTLVDTGYIGGWETTKQALEDLGLSLDRIKRIILTHNHCDHVGGVPEIKAASNCRVALHRISRHAITTKNDWSTWWRYYDQQAEFFETDEPLRSGDLVKLAGMDFEVIHTPGHAAGQIALFQPDSGLLFSSDAWWDGDLGALTPRIEGLDCVFRALESLQRLYRLKPKRVYPGHGPAFTDIDEAYEKTEAKLRRFIEEPRLQGRDQIKKIMLYTLLMKGGMPSGTLFENLTDAPWFHETVSLFFGADRPRPIFDQLVENLLESGALVAEGAVLTPAVPA